MSNPINLTIRVKDEKDTLSRKELLYDDNIQLSMKDSRILKLVNETVAKFQEDIDPEEKREAPKITVKASFVIQA